MLRALLLKQPHARDLSQFISPLCLLCCWSNLSECRMGGSCCAPVGSGDLSVLGRCGKRSRSPHSLGHSSLSSCGQRSPHPCSGLGAKAAPSPHSSVWQWMPTGSCRQGEHVTAGLSVSGDPAWPQPGCPVEIHSQCWGPAPSLRLLTLGCTSMLTSLWSLIGNRALSSEAKPAFALCRERVCFNNTQ